METMNAKKHQFSKDPVEESYSLRQKNIYLWDPYRSNKLKFDQVYNK
jgi:hypothetical protein